MILRKAKACRQWRYITLGQKAFTCEGVVTKESPSLGRTLDDRLVVIESTDYAYTIEESGDLTET